MPQANQPVPLVPAGDGDSSVEYRPAFSAWRRRFDPFLAAEDTNAIFQAFRERSFRHWSHRGSPRKWIGRLNPSRNGAGIAICFYFAIFGFQHIGWGALVLALALAFVVKYVFPAREGPPVLGHALETILVDSRPNRAIMTDLTLAGGSGRVFMETLYLEEAQRTAPTTLAIIPILFAAVTIPLYLRMGFLFQVGSLVYCTATLFLGWLIFRLLLANTTGLIYTQTLLPLIGRWSRVSRLPRAYKRQPLSTAFRFLYMLLHLITVVILPAFVMLEFIVVLVGLLEPSSAPKALEVLNMGLPFPWLAAVVTLFMSLVVFGYWRFLQVLNFRKMAYLLADADAHFDGWFAERIMGEGLGKD